MEKNARVRYTTVQNWSNNVYNLVTQRAYVREGATMEWVDGNIGSKATMKYPACILAEPYASASTMSLGFAGKGQYQDTGAKMIHLGPPYLFHHRREVHIARRWAFRLSRTCQDRRRRRRVELQCGV